MNFEATPRSMRKPALSGLLCGLALMISTVSARAAIFTVNSTADPGVGACDAAECTLREALLAANAAGGADNIKFNIPAPVPAGGFFTISVLSALPVIT